MTPMSKNKKMVKQGSFSRTPLDMPQAYNVIKTSTIPRLPIIEVKEENMEKSTPRNTNRSRLCSLVNLIPPASEPTILKDSFLMSDLENLNPSQTKAMLKVYRGDARSNERIISILQQMQREGMEDIYTDFIDFSFIRRLLFLHNYDELKVFDVIQSEFVRHLYNYR